MRKLTPATVLLVLTACTSNDHGALNRSVGQQTAPTAASTSSSPPGSSTAAVHQAAPLGNSRIRYVSDVPAPYLANPSQPSNLIVATDPDADSIWIVGANVSGPMQLQFSPGSEPGDIAIGWRPGANLVLENVIYVSLHHGGEIVSIPVSTVPDSGAVPYKLIPTCAEPRGMDTYPNGAGSTLYVACSDGVLQTIDSVTDTVVGTIPLVDDLKDVVVIDGVTALVTQFRAANILQVDLSGVSATTTTAIPGTSDRSADVAWQMIPLGGSFPRTGALIAHQLASTTVIDVAVSGGGGEGLDAGPIGEGPNDAGSPNIPPSPPDDFDGGPFPPGPPGCDPGTPGPEGGDDNMQCQQSGYGPSTCQSPCGGPPVPACQVGVVAAAATIVQMSSGGGFTMSAPAMLNGVVPPLTIAHLSPLTGGDEQAVVFGIGDAIGIAIDIPMGIPSCLGQTEVSGISGLAAATVDPQAPNAANPTFFTRQLSISSAFVVAPNGPVFLPLQKIVGMEGRDVFHEATPSFMSCASCHPNGRDDGHIWNFNPMGLRRTPSLGGGLLATAPFHWDGVELDISMLMTDVFVNRMEGTPPSADDVTDISNWLDSRPVSYDHAAPDPSAVTRGQTLFQSSAVGCTTCHSGAHFTNNLTLNVGTGGAFQVPSLLGVGSRPPYLHDGRAATLADRFDPTLGGGDLHGHTSQLTTDQISDLVAYLRSL